MLDGVWLKLHLMPELSCFTHLRVDWKLQCCQSLFIGHPPSTKGIVAARAVSNEMKSEKCMGDYALLLSCTIPSISQHDVCWLQDCQLLWVFIVINLNQIWLLFQRIDTWHLLSANLFKKPCTFDLMMFWKLESCQRSRSTWVGYQVTPRMTSSDLICVSDPMIHWINRFVCASWRLLAEDFWCGSFTTAA